MKSRARERAMEAASAGMAIAGLKAAAGGDLETYLAEKQNALTAAGISSKP